MKRLFAVIVALVFIFSASLALADGDGVKSTNTVTDTLKQGQTQAQTAVGGQGGQGGNASAQSGIAKQGQGQSQQNGGSNSVSIDQSSNGNVFSTNFPFVPGNPSMFPPGYFPGYERQVNDMSSKQVVEVIGRVSQASFARYKARIVSRHGEDDFKKMQENIYVRPALPGDNCQPVSEVLIIKTLPDGAVLPQPMGFVSGDTWLTDKQLKKRQYQYLPYTEDIHMRVGVEVLSEGVNVMMWIPEGDFFRAYITPNGKQWGIGASGGAIQAFGELLTGLSLGPQYTSANQSTTMVGGKALKYVCFHVDNLEAFLHPPVKVEVVTPAPVPEPKKPVCNPNEIWLRIQTYLELCLNCPKPCLNNVMGRGYAGLSFEDYIHCTGEKKFYADAIEQFKKAEKDYLTGYEPSGAKTKDVKGARDMMARIYYNWSLSIRETEGKERQYAFVRLHADIWLRAPNGELAVPTCYEDLKR
jgi:hypothetical protein